ncbi:MAG: superoxide dismutase [bacterium]
MAFTLPELPYAYDALEPYIDARTMEIHLTKHHQAYINNLNNALKDQPEWESKPIEEIVTTLNQVPETIRTAVRNNAGGHLNHSMFWKLMKKGGEGEPTGPVVDAIKKSFGDFKAFQEEFTKAAVSRFGSGWAWLIFDKVGNLAVTSTANQDNPLTEGFTPILGLDVWEHAYYLNYQNRRPDYINAWWSVVNWEQVNENFERGIVK